VVRVHLVLAQLFQRGRGLHRGGSGGSSSSSDGGFAALHASNFAGSCDDGQRPRCVVFVALLGLRPLQLALVPVEE
jgi:hypothetical protein